MSLYKLRYRPDDQSLEQLLRSFLQQAPYWAAGHAQIARLFLRLNKVEQAYFAAQTLKTLSFEASSWEPDFLIGVCFLRNGSADKAIAVLAVVHESNPQNAAVAEEYAAALMGAGRYQDAMAVVEKIPERVRSVELHAAYAGCKEGLNKQGPTSIP